MEEKKASVNSRLKVSEEVIINAVKIATLDVKGVAGLSGSISRLNRVVSGGPIKITYIGDVVSADVRIIAESTAKSLATAESVQSAVKENIQDMLGITVAKVNVIVDGIDFSK